MFHFHLYVSCLVEKAFIEIMLKKIERKNNVYVI